MTLVKVKAAQITLPNKVREALEIDDGDYLEIELVEGGALLKRATDDRDAIREAAWRRIKEAMATAKWTGPGPEPSEEEVMREVVEEIKAMRRENAARRSR